MTIFYMILAICIIAIVLLILINISNNCLKITKYKVKNSKLPDNFNNMKIVHISDVHSKIFGKNNEEFIKKVKKINPDIIIMSGDIIDDSTKDVNSSITSLKEIYSNYPTFYSIGNHERKLGYKSYKKYIELLRDNGVNVLVNEGVYFKRGKEEIKINALKFRENMQPKILTEEKKEKYIKYMKNKLKDININEFNILIAHDPENFELYEKLGVDLIFSGHIHGGLIRIGKLCLFSPRRKLFPKYSYGKYKLNNTTLITSSGIGKASIPIRLFNRPEIVEVILNK
ncbi:MAG: metallophosphoesterase [Clostridia bacterium]